MCNLVLPHMMIGRKLCLILFDMLEGTSAECLHTPCFGCFQKLDHGVPKDDVTGWNVPTNAAMACHPVVTVDQAAVEEGHRLDAREVRLGRR